jgi:hypothetical protein
MKRILLLLTSLTLMAATTVAQEIPELKKGDSKKLAKAVGGWFNADIANDAAERLDSRDEILKVLEGFEKKKIGATEIYSYLNDWQAALEGRGGKYPKAKPGKFAKTKKDLAGGGPIEYWVPNNYKPKNGGVPLVLFAGDGGKLSQESISGLPAEILADCVVAPVTLAGLEGEDLLSDGRNNLLYTVALLTLELRLDRNRVYLLAGGEAVEPATYLSSWLPHLTAGISTYGGEVSTEITEKNKELLKINSADDLAGAASWILTAPPRNLYRSEVNFDLSPPKFPRFYWVQVKKFDPPEDGKVATISVKADRATNTITIEAERVYQVELFLNYQLVDLNKPIKVIRNGQELTLTANPGFSTLLDGCRAYLWDTSCIFPSKLRGIDIPAKE